MTADDFDLITVAVLLALALLAPMCKFLIDAWRVRRMTRRRRSIMRTADSGKIERETRRLRAGPLPAPQAPSAGNVIQFSVLDPSPEARATIARRARMAACDDFHKVVRPSANPYARHSRNYAMWALEYACAWNVLSEEAKHDGAPNPHSHGHGPQEVRP